MIGELFDGMEKRVWTASMPVSLACMFVMHFMLPLVAVERLVKRIFSKSEEELNEDDICWLLFGCAPHEVDWNRVVDMINESNLSVARCAEIFNELHQREQA